MLRPRWRKVLTDLWEDKTRTLLVVASIAVGVFAVGMIASSYIIISQDMNTSYTAANPANIRIFTDDFNNELLKAVQRMDAVKDAEGRRQANLRVLNGKGEWTSLDLTAVSDFSDMNINQIIYSSGASTLDDNQVIIENNQKFKSLHAQVGDILEIELADGTTRNLSFVGTVEDETGGINNLVGNVEGYITYDTLEWLHLPESYNTIYVTVVEEPNDHAHIQNVADQISDQLEKSGRYVYRTELYLSNQHPMRSLIQALLGILLILGILIVFLSGSLITNTLSALLNQHLRQIGVMKLIGARSSQIIGMYLVLILIFGIIASLIAIPLGSQAGYALSRFAASFIGFKVQGFRIIPLAMILQIIIAIFVPLLSGILPVSRGARITILNAITHTGLGDGVNRKSRFDQMMDNLRGISRPLLISLRNTFRRKGRLALTLFTLTLGGAIFIAVFNVEVALNYQMQQSLKYFMADVNLDFERYYRNSTVEQIAMNIPGVKSVESWLMSKGELLKSDGTIADNITIIAPPINSQLIEPILLEGRWLKPGDENVITVNETFWENHPDLKTGDVLRLKIDGKEDDWQVVGIFQYSGVDELFIYSSYEYLSMYLNKSNLAINYRIALENHDAASQEQLSTQIDYQFREMGYHVNKVEAGSATITTVTEYIGVLTAVLLIMALLTATVGSIGLAGTLSMNVLERTREIGVMRAIGAHNQIVMKLVIVEGLVIGAISYLAGAIISFPITTLLSNVISLAIFNTPSDFIFTWQGFVIWLVVVIILSVVSSIIPARHASRLTIREVLAYE